MDARTRVPSLAELISVLEIDEHALGDGGTGKRSTPRFPLVIPVSVRAIKEDGPGPETTCRLWDISATGMCTTSYFRFEEGQRLLVELVIEDIGWCGEMRVMHCTQTISGYKIGLRLARPEEKLAEDAIATSESRSARQDRDWLPQTREEVARSMKGYQRARQTWGLLGLSVRKLIRKAIHELPEVVPEEETEGRRLYARFPADIDTHLILAAGYGWHRLAARIENISEGGMRLLLNEDVVQTGAEREMMGDCTVREGMPVMVGFGSEPDTVWVPAEIVRCEPPVEGMVRVGILFETPAAIEFFSRSAH
jgi:hypothetical protein